MDHHHHQDASSSGGFSFSLGPVRLFGLQAGPGLFSFLLALFVVISLGVARQEAMRLGDLPDASIEAKTAYYFVQAALSYVLMLVAMTFNFHLFLGVVVGLTVGHYRTLKLAPQAKQQECCA